MKRLVLVLALCGATGCATPQPAEEQHGKSMFGEALEPTDTSRPSRATTVDAGTGIAIPHVSGWNSRKPKVRDAAVELYDGDRRLHVFTHVTEGDVVERIETIHEDFAALYDVQQPLETVDLGDFSVWRATYADRAQGLRLYVWEVPHDGYLHRVMTTIPAAEEAASKRDLEKFFQGLQLVRVTRRSAMVNEPAQRPGRNRPPGETDAEFSRPGPGWRDHDEHLPGVVDSWVRPGVGAIWVREVVYADAEAARARTEFEFRNNAEAGRVLTEPAEKTLGTIDGRYGVFEIKGQHTGVFMFVIDRTHWTVTLQAEPHRFSALRKTLERFVERATFPDETDDDF